MEPKPLSCILRRNGKLPPLSYRRYPFDTGSRFGKEEMKEEVVRLGVDISLLVSETMFLLCDDIRTMLWFCATLQRLLLVFHHVYSDYIKPKSGVFHNDDNSVRWRLIGDTWEDFTEGIIVVHRLVMVLEEKITLTTIKQKHAMKKVEDKLRSTKEVMMDGFARETIESNVTDLWKSLFYEEAGEAAPKVKRIRILKDLCMPLLDDVHSEMLALPPPSLPYILGSLLICYGFAISYEEMQERTGVLIVRGGEAALYYIILKKGVYRKDGEWVQWRLIMAAWKDLDAGIRDLDRLVLNLRGRGYSLTG
ncbi:unnamed protein product, partial [Thlaspi arvense]